MNTTISHDKHTIISYFCGCGGLDLGFRGGFIYRDTVYEYLPFKILAAYDFNKQCIETYNSYFKESNAYLVDLSVSKPEDMPACDVLIGGFPCQEFSACGPLGGLESERGQLYKTMVRYMQVHKPKLVVGENVINIARMQKGKILKVIVNDLENAGYNVQTWEMFAPNYGVPQRRRRLFFICTRNDLLGSPIPPIAHFIDKPRSIEWAIGDLVNITDESVRNQSQYYNALPAKNGCGQGDETCLRTMPSYTIRANPRARIQFHYELNRRLTMRECARIQTFPDDFVFSHSMTHTISQIGNAVPPILAHSIAKSINKYLSELENYTYDTI
ncbi:MAG: DNA cytosine methyltransferase [Christensenellaceae bacterium]|jgi:DNA (cytosine-5)-methyltransferase 1|nr:DNA cytosine methyltransferase [Christensenellaceae bacterium]